MQIYKLAFMKTAARQNNFSKSDFKSLQKCFKLTFFFLRFRERLFIIIVAYMLSKEPFNLNLVFNYVVAEREN